MCSRRTRISVETEERSSSRKDRFSAAARVVFPEPAGPSTQTSRPDPSVGREARTVETISAAVASTGGSRAVTASGDAVSAQDLLDVVHVLVLHRGLGLRRPRRRALAWQLLPAVG